MDELDHALTEIAAIRGQMARSAEFRGYGPATVLGTAVLAVLAGLAQSIWIPHPLRAPGLYAGLWSLAAALSAGLIGTEAIARTRRMHGGLADEMIQAALEQFLPAGIAGLLLTAVLLRAAPGDAALLPGLWQVIFSLGVFATCRILPRSIFAVALWYLATGLTCLALSGGAAAFSPWMMAAPFAAGQALSAILLWRASLSAAMEKEIEEADEKEA